MLETLNQIKESATIFQGTGQYFALFFIMLIYLIMEYQKQYNREILWYTLIVLGIICCPLTANNIMDYWTGKENYWIVFYLVPVIVLVAYGMTSFVCRQNRIRKMLVSVCIFMFIIFLAGTYDYQNNLFYNISCNHNLEKVSDETIEISKMLSDIDDVKMIAADGVCSEIREYDSKIKLLYGNDIVSSQPYGVWSNEKENLKQLYQSVKESENPLEQMVVLAEQYSCNSIVIEEEYQNEEYMKNCGYKFQGETENYVIYVKML